MSGKLDRKLVKEVCWKSSGDFLDLKALDVSKRNLNDVRSHFLVKTVNE